MKVTVRLTIDPRPLENFTGILIPPWAECFVYKNGKRIATLTDIGDAYDLLDEAEIAVVEDDK